MFDNTNFTVPPVVTGPPKPPEPPTTRPRREPPKPVKPCVYCEPFIRDPAFCYALQGPDGWCLALVEKEPFPDAYVLTIWREPDRATMLYRDTFTTWRGLLRDDDEVYDGFHALLGGAIRAVTGSTEGWSMISRPLTTDELIELDTERDPQFRGEAYSFLL
jgi:hypothetical protein